MIPHGVGKCRGATKKAPLKRVIPHGVGKCHVVTKGTLSRQELAVSNANRLRDYSGSLEKGAGREFASGLRD